jgi:DNA repair exonuclease SbcCD ATPase subunit
MIVESITLSGWRCFAEEVSVGPLSERLNVISGPNGIGKSTLFEGLRRALMDSHAVSGQEVVSLRPWGRALVPKVAVHFSHNGVQYRMTKQFLDSPFSRLERRENGVYRPVAEGRQADDRARALLTHNPPGRGLSQARHWGLAQVLWAPQGELKLLDLSGDLISDIRTVLGAQVSDAASGPIEEKIVEVYDRYFTRQGKYKTGKSAPPITRLQAALEQAHSRRGQALEMLQNCEEASRRVEELGARHHQLSLEAEEVAKTVQTTRQRSEQHRALKAEVGNKEGELAKVEAQHRQLHQQIDLIRATGKELEDRQTELARLASEEPLQRREVESREREAAAAKEALARVRKEEQSVARAEAEAETARQYLDAGARRIAVHQHIEKIEAAERTLAEHRKARSALVAPERRTLNALRRAVRERDEARLLLDAAMINLEIIAEADGQLEVRSGEEPGRKALTAGKATVIKGAPEVAVELKGVARLRASGPTGDIEVHRRAVRQKEQEIAELSRPFGTTDIGRLEALADRAEELDRRIGEACKALETLLGDDEIQALQNDRNRLDALLHEIEKVHPGWRESAPDIRVLKQAAADQKQLHSRRVAEAEAAWERAQSTLSAAREQQQVAARRLEDIRKGVAVLEARWAELTRDGKTLEDREQELRRTLLEWDAGKAALKELQEKLVRFDDDPETALQKLEQNLEALQAGAQRTRDEERTAMGTLEALAARGPYSILAQAEEEVAALEGEIRRETLRMKAIKLLHDTVAQCRAEAMASVTGPVEEAATRLLHRIAGRRLGRIAIGEAFEPAGVCPELVDSPVDLLNLSGGEQEQLYLATRLALAEVLAREERQMVVLDDVLTATDAGRLARVMNLLEEAADRLQILVLTCHPERYRALAEAAFFDLESLTRRSRGAAPSP